MTSRASRSPRSPSLRRLLTALSALAACLGVAAPVAGAALLAGDTPVAEDAPSLSWSAPEHIDDFTWRGTQAELRSVSCPAVSVCVAVDYAGAVFATTDRGAPAGAWTTTAPIAVRPTAAGPRRTRLNVVDCSSAQLCLAGGAFGSLSRSLNPVAASPAWTTRFLSHAGQIRGISCPSERLCVAVDGDRQALVSTDPDAATPRWRRRRIDSLRALNGVACPSAQLCVALEGGPGNHEGGAMFVDRDPTRGGSWRRTVIDPGHVNCGGARCGGTLLALACPSRRECVALDNLGRVVTIADPATRHPRVRRIAVDPMLRRQFGERDGWGSSSLSCPSESRCIVVDTRGYELLTDDATARHPHWSVPVRVDPPVRPGTEGGPDHVDCASDTACAIVDRAGRVLVSR